LIRVPPNGPPFQRFSPTVDNRKGRPFRSGLFADVWHLFVCLKRCLTPFGAARRQDGQRLVRHPDAVRNGQLLEIRVAERGLQAGRLELGGDPVAGPVDAGRARPPAFHLGRRQVRHHRLVPPDPAFW